MGHQVEFGPFGSTAVVPADQVGAAAALVVATAFERGATHVNLDVAKLAEAAADTGPGA